MNFLRHPYTARILTCLTAGLLLSLMAIFPASSEIERKHHLYVATDGSTDDIRLVIKSLGRSDIHIRENDDSRMALFDEWLFVSVYGTVISALGWAGISGIHSALRNTLKTNK